MQPLVGKLYSACHTASRGVHRHMIIPISGQHVTVPLPSPPCSPWLSSCGWPAVHLARPYVTALCVSCCDWNGGKGPGGEVIEGHCAARARLVACSDQLLSVAERRALRNHPVRQCMHCGSSAATRRLPRGTDVTVQKG